MDITIDTSRKLVVNGINLRVAVSLTVDDETHGIKVIESGGRLSVAMPSQKDDKGIVRDIVYPVGREFREPLEEAVTTEHKARLAVLQVDADTSEDGSANQESVNPDQ